MLATLSFGSVLARRSPVSAIRMGLSTHAHARIVVSQQNTASEVALRALAEVDAGFASRVVTAASDEHERLVLSPTGPLEGDTDDVRKVGAAAEAGAGAALAMGATEVTLAVDESIDATHHPADGDAYEHAAFVAMLGVLQRAYVPLQAREAAQPPPPTLEKVSLHGRSEAVAALAAAV